jgi:small subunit ribosomal protein S4
LARQMVTHGHFTVNGKRLDVPSYEVKIGDKIAIRDGSKNKALFAEMGKKMKNHVTPEWLKFDSEKAVGEMKARPKLGTAEALNFPAVIEFYSR